KRSMNDFAAHQGDDHSPLPVEAEESDAEASFVADTQIASGVGGSRPDTRKK
ncbi:hypothetical protein Tco_0479676, partial [Tanacetum coccineum]